MGLIRTLLAISVVFWHSPLKDSFVFVGGENAVRLFYISSGYLISLVLASGAYDSTKTFYVNRWLRLWPIYAAVVLASLGWNYLATSGFLGLFAQYPLPAAIGVAIANVTILGQDWLFFIPSEKPLHILLVDPPSWTLGVEMSFYLIAPFVLRRRPVLIALLVMSLALRVFLVSSGRTGDPWSYRFFPAELAWFLFGALSQQVLAPLYRRWLKERLGSVATVATAGFAALLCVFHLLPLRNVGGAALLVVLFIALVPMFVEFQANRKWDRRIGDYSYPIYIGHYLLLQFADTLGTRTGITAPAAVTTFVVLGSIALAWGLNRFVGDPVERLRRRVRGSQGLQATPSGDSRNRLPTPGTRGVHQPE
jgi:peptidoglycan/LPS O-acetylase OafA/YrhL